MEAKTLVETLADTLEEAEVEKLKNTLSDVEMETLIEKIADTLLERKGHFLKQRQRNSFTRKQRQSP